MKNTKIIVCGLLALCVGVFVLLHYAIPSANAAQAKVGKAPALEGIAYPGEIRAFAGLSCPSGWLLADGSEIRDTDHPALVGAIGDLWGSTVVGKFKLPDLRGVFIRGWNNKRTDGDPEAMNRSIPQGAPIDPNRKGDQVGTYQEDQFKSHHHVTHATARWGTGTPIRSDSGLTMGSIPAGRTPICLRMTMADPRLDPRMFMCCIACSTRERYIRGDEKPVHISGFSVKALPCIPTCTKGGSDA